MLNWRGEIESEKKNDKWGGNWDLNESAEEVNESVDIIRGDLDVLTNVIDNEVNFDFSKFDIEDEIELDENYFSEEIDAFENLDTKLKGFDQNIEKHFEKWNSDFNHEFTYQEQNEHAQNIKNQSKIMIIEKVKVRIDAYIAQINITNKVPVDDLIAEYRQAYVLYEEAKQLELEEKYKDAFKRYLDTFKLFRKVYLVSERINRLLEKIELDPLGDYDEDGLLNGYELEAFMGTLDPTKKDTNSDGVIDSKEDYEEDGLTNLEEQEYGTDPLYYDTDFDGLTDYEEIHTTKTDPTLEDPDEDELSDINEIKYGMDPFVYDTDGDGIKDGDEVFSVYIEASQIESDPNVKPSIKMELEGKNISNVYISNVGEGNPYLTKNIPGYIGAAFDFHAPMTFEKAEMKFEFNKELINDDFYPAIYYFNPETNLIELLENQIVNFEDGSVTTEVTHFSTYIVLNKISVDEFWAAEMLAPIIGGDNPAEDISTIIGFTIDSSGSMAWNDPAGIRKQTAKNFVDKLDDNDMAAVIDFDSYAKTYCQLTSDKAVIKAAIDRINSSGGTNLTAGMERAIEEIKDNPSDAKFIIMITDGEGQYNNALTQQAIDLGIIVYTIGLGPDTDVTLLRNIAESTGGKFFYAETSDELIHIFDETSEEMLDHSKDTDEDGLSDFHEKNGVRTEIGWIKTNFQLKDTDYDGIPDGEELVYIAPEDIGPGTPSFMASDGYFKAISDPREKDSDFDGLDDKIDPEPMVFSITDRTLALAAELSYTNLHDETGSTISSLIDEEFTFDYLSYAQPKEVEISPMDYNHLYGVKPMKIVSANDSASGYWGDFWDAGLGSVALRIKRTGKSDAIILAFRGTEPNRDILNDGTQDIMLGVGADSIQSKHAFDEYKELVKEYPNAEFYLTGHSLGGRLTQDMFYKVYLVNHDLFSFNNTKVPTHGATFNALGYNRIQYEKMYNSIINAVENKLNNYYIYADVVGSIFGASIAFERIGTDIEPWVGVDKNGETIDVTDINRVIYQTHLMPVFFRDSELNYPKLTIY